MFKAQKKISKQIHQQHFGGFSNIRAPISRIVAQAAKTVLTHFLTLAPINLSLARNNTPRNKWSPKGNWLWRLFFAKMFGIIWSLWKILYVASSSHLPLLLTKSNQCCEAWIWAKATTNPTPPPHYTFVNRYTSGARVHLELLFCWWHLKDPTCTEDERPFKALVRRWQFPLWWTRAPAC